MNPRPSISHCTALALTLTALLLLVASPSASAAEKPNILIFYVDDMGWAQPGCYGGKMAATPNIDALAKGGVRFTDGYSSGCICSPGRVGLLTGRYQARTGHDANPQKAGRELLLTETTMAQRLKSIGYTTGIVGKWHLGDTAAEFMPPARGFDFAVGSIGNLGEGKGPAFYRGTEKMENLAGAPITSPVYAREAAGYMEQSKDKPWFLYLAFNAVHAPHVASPKWLEKFKHLPKHDQQYAALVAEADEAVGDVMAKLREMKQEENTLIFLISDNGGAYQNAEMGGLRGHKWYVWEGGIRVSWIASWKGRIPGGRVSHEPVIQLDVLPTALAAAGAEVKPEWQIDGVNLLPLLEGKADKLASRELFFRFGVQHAVRSGDWKLVKAGKDMEPMLVNLAQDIGEQKDLSAQFPDKKKDLQSLFDKWNATMQLPRWQDQRWDGGENRKEVKQERRKGKNSGMKVTALILSFLACVSCAAENAKPNIVFILADDLGWADVAFHGGNAPTPHLDKLARDGLELTQHYVAPVCSPTRSAFMTGRCWSRFNVTTPQSGRALPWDTVTLPRALKSVGYDTCLTGKWHLGSVPAEGPNHFGFDHSYGSLGGGVSPWNHRYKQGPISQTWHRDEKFVEEEGHATDLITKEAVTWIESRGTAPFFLYVPFTAVHLPLKEPADWLARAPAGITGDVARHYAACVMHLDDSVGKILAALDKKGVRDNTLVVFTSDNGGSTAENNDLHYPDDNCPNGKLTGNNKPWRGQKGDLYEGGTRVPAIISWPGHAKPGKVATPVQITDWMPTFTAIVGWRADHDLKWDGTDLTAVLTQHAALPDRPLYAVAPNWKSRSVRFGNWKLIVHDEKKERRVELFDLAADPSEAKNLADADPERLVQLTKLMEEISARDRDAVPKD